MSFRGAPRPHETDREIFFSTFRKLGGGKSQGQIPKDIKDCKDRKDKERRSQLSFLVLQSLQSLMSLLRFLDREVCFQAEVGRQAAEEPADSFRIEAGRDQTAMDLHQTPVPGRVQLPLGPAQDGRDVCHAEAVEKAQLEQEAFLGGKRPEKGAEDIAEADRGARPFPVHDPALDLAVDRDLEELLLARPPPLPAARGGPPE